MRRREFVALLGVGAAALPVAAHAQESERAVPEERSSETHRGVSIGSLAAASAPPRVWAAISKRKQRVTLALASMATKSSKRFPFHVGFSLTGVSTWLIMTGPRRVHSANNPWPAQRFHPIFLEVGGTHLFVPYDAFKHQDHAKRCRRADNVTAARSVGDLSIDVTPTRSTAVSGR